MHSSQPLTTKLAAIFRAKLKLRGWRSNGSSNPELWTPHKSGDGGRPKWYTIERAVLVSREMNRVLDKSSN